MAAESSNFSAPCVPKFDGDYDHWSLLMENLLRSKEYWCVIQPGFKEPGEGEVLSAAQQKVLDEARLKDLKAKNYLFQSIDKSILKTITQKETAKLLWDSMKVKYQGNERVKRAQLQRLRRVFETLEMKVGETVTDYFGRVMVTANDMRNCGENMEDVKIVEKILRTLTENFNYVVCSIEESKDIDQMTVDGLHSSLLVHEQKIRRRGVEEQVLKVEYDNSGRGRGRGYNGRRGGSNVSRGRGGTRPSFDKATIECFRCHKLGHFQYECPTAEKEANYAEFDEGEALLLMAQTETQETKKSGLWFLDSGCSNHMTGNKEWFMEIDDSFRHAVRLGNSSRMEVVGKGDVKFEVGGVTQIVSDVFFVPNLTNNLLSVGQLQEKGVDVLISKGVCKIYHPRRGLIVSTKMTANRMFIVSAIMKTDPNQCLKIEEDEVATLWHKRYGHLNNTSIQSMHDKKLVNGLPPMKEIPKVCEVCNIGKQHREIIPKKSQWRAAEKLKLIHADLCGPISPTSHSGKRYIFLLIDDFSRKSWIYLLSEKNEAFDTFKIFKALVEKESGTEIGCLRTDRGGEFTSNVFNQFCEENGIKRQLTAAYTPQQNGVAERRNRTIMNMVRCLLTEKSMPKRFWPEAAKWTCHVLNRSVTSAVKDMVPEECWSGIKPSVNYFRVFGCIGHAHVPEQRRIKLDSRSRKCILLGVSEESKAYRLYDPISKTVVTSRDVIFEEEEKWDWSADEKGLSDVLDWGEEEDQNREDAAEEIEEEVEIEEHLNVENLNSPQPEIREQRERRAPIWMQDYESGERISDGEAEAELAMALFLSHGDPVQFTEASKEEKWMEAMRSEIQSIEKNDTWDLVRLPAEAKRIGVKWVFKTKLNEDGKVDKYKARLVVKGYAQEEGIDYDEVFAPVARWDTIRILLAVSAQRGWKVYQLDVKSAFLYGELKEVVYVDQPEGFVKKGEEDKVYRLKKALYGLKQAPRAWFSRIEGYFKQAGFNRSSHDHTLFIKREGERQIMVSIYVDDLIFAGNDDSLLEEFKQSMKQEFEMTDLGLMRFFLGVEVRQTPDGIHLCQKKYAMEVLERFKMADCNSVKNPIVPGAKLSKEGGGEEADATLYKQLVGCLMYLTVTRPDMMYVVCLLSRFMAKPREEHMLAAKRALRYLKGTLELGIFYKRGAELKVEAYTDSDYAGDVDDRKSTSGYVFLLSGAAVCWSSRKQEVVTLSSTEAEYVAATACACHCVWIKGVMEQNFNEECKCMEIYCDNTSSIKLAKNPVMHRRTKHIDVRYHYLRDLTNQEVVKLVFCGTAEQIADIMTKPVKLETFIKMRSLLGMQAQGV